MSITDERQAEWKMVNSHTGMVAATFKRRSEAERFLKKYDELTRRNYTVTGPDEGEGLHKVGDKVRIVEWDREYPEYEKYVGTEGEITRVCDESEEFHYNVRLHDGGVWYYSPDEVATITGPNQPASEAEPVSNSDELPAITFKPWVQPRPKLDQMPELGKGGRSHRVTVAEDHSKLEGTPRVLVLGLCRGNAHYVDPTDEIGDASTLPASDFTVLDAEPAPPKTLADVPEGCWCESRVGGLCTRSTTQTDRVIWLTSHHDDLQAETAQCPIIQPKEIPITRVLGFPVLNIAAQPQEGE